MMNLRRLVLTGIGVEPATMDFVGGLNVISGASNTGKSYIVRCIDYMLGAEKLSKFIEEASGYNSLFLELGNASGEVLTLERGMNGGDVAVYQRPFAEVGDESGETVLWRRDNSGRKDLSSVLMAFAGIPPAKVRSNAQGKTVRLSFRMLAPLFIVSENAIIEERSPILDGKGYEETARLNTFSFVLTGKDDSGILPQGDAKLARAAATARIELIKKLIDPVEKRVAALPKDDRPPAERIEQLDANIELISSAMAEDEAALAELRERRSQTLDAMFRAESQVIAQSELRRRFDLLMQRYRSDLDRLDFIAEATYYFDQLQTVSCPLCGQAMNAEHMHRIVEAPEAATVQKAAQVEAAKIRSLKKDLEASTADLDRRLKEKRHAVGTARASLAEIDTELRGTAGSRLLELKKRLSHMIRSRLDVEAEQTDRDQLLEYQVLLKDAERDARPIPRTKWSMLDPVAADELCREVEAILAEWNWPGEGRVSFDDEANDIRVDGKPRQSNGKGVRALLHSAFSLALLIYSDKKKLPHPGFLLLDSPLTTFKEGRSQDPAPTEDDEISADIEQAFFRSLASVPTHLQVVVLDNKAPQPPTDGIKFEYFSGAPGTGRQGFIPLSTQQPPLAEDESEPR